MTGGWGGGPPPTAAAGRDLPHTGRCRSRRVAGLPGGIPDNSHYREYPGNPFAELAISSCPAMPCPAMRALPPARCHRYSTSTSDSDSDSGATNATRMGRSPSPPSTCTLSPYIRGRALLSSHCRVLSRS
jgi:hypothetical protein